VGNGDDNKTVRATPDALRSGFATASIAGAGTAPSPHGEIGLPDRYRDARDLARGGMGRVVEATDQVLGRSVAVKIVLDGNADTLQRFAREMRITARLEHPSIVPIHDAGVTTTGAPFYVMRKVSGRPLDKVIASAASLDARLALLPHALAAIQAVAHAHGRGIIHRDIKPPNILVGELGETMVIDWGLAKVIGELDDARPEERPAGESFHTRHGAVFGTPGFMSPEQLHASDVDERADVYALGATLYHLLAQRPPHADASATKMMEIALAGPPASIESLVPGVPPELATIVDKALAYDASTRYRTAGALAEDLQRFLTGQLVASHRYTRAQRLWRAIKRNKAIVATIALATIATGVVAWLAFDRVIAARDEALEQAALKEAARAREAARSEDLTFGQARMLTRSDPAGAIALVKPFASGPRWREVRAIAAAARGFGVPRWIAPPSHDEELSPDHRTIVTQGEDRILRTYDVTTGTLRELGGPRVALASSIRFADNTHVMATAVTEILRIDLAAHTVEIVETPETLAKALALAVGNAYVIGADGTAWRLAATSKKLERLAIADEIEHVAASPRGTHVAFGGKAALWLLEPTTGAIERVANGPIFDLHWGEHEGNERLLARTHNTIDIRWSPKRSIDIHVESGSVALANDTRFTLDYRNGFLYNSVRVEANPPGRWGAFGEMLVPIADGFVAATMHDEIWLTDGNTRHAIPYPDQYCRVVGARGATFLVNACQSGMFTTDLRPIVPARYHVDAARPRAEAGPTAALVVQYGGIAELDLVTGTLDPWAVVPDATDIHAVSPDGSRAIIQQTNARMTVIDRAGAVLSRLETVVVAAFIDNTRIAIGTQSGEVTIVELAGGGMRVVHDAGESIGWIAAHDGWVTAQTMDRTLVRHHLATGATTTTKFERQDFVLARAALHGADGSIWWTREKTVSRWAPDGSISEVAQLPRTIQYVDHIANHVIARVEGGTVYAIGAGANPTVTPLGPGLGDVPAPHDGEVALLTASSTGFVRPGPLVIDARGGFAWRAAHLCDSAYPAVTRDGRWLFATSNTQLHVWALDLPRDAAQTARWIASLTNATHDPATGLTTWPSSVR
jgi:hypothetical protein